MTYPLLPTGRAPQPPTWQTEIAKLKSQIDELSRTGSLPAVPKFSAHQATAQNTTNSTNTQMTLDTVDWDTVGGWNPTTNTYTFQVAGYYTVLGGVEWAANTAGVRQCWVTDDTLTGGSFPFSYSLASAPGAGLATLPTRTFDWFFAVGDYIQLWSSQGSGGTLATVSLGSFLQVHILD